MALEPNAIEDLFERNADMRLLERRHAELGLPPTDGAIRRSGSGFGAESIVHGGADLPVDPTARLRVAIAAAPQTGVIPGAVVGIAIDIFNDGSAPAPESLVLLSLPHETSFRGGSLRIDGREPAAPERLFGAGLPVPRLPGETSSKVTLQLQILPGVNAIFLQPRLQTDGVTVVGTVGISIKRGKIVSTAPPDQAPPRPFYELEEDEVEETQAADDDVQPILPPVLNEAAEAVAVPVEAAAAVAAVAEAATPVAEPEPAAKTPAAPAKPRGRAKSAAAPLPFPEPEPAPAARVEPPMVQRAPDDRMPRFRTVGPAELALVERLFAAPIPGPIAHFVAISTFACTQAGDGTDPNGFDALVRHDLAELGRAVVLARMGKTSSYHIDQTELDAIVCAWEPGGIVSAGSPGRFRRDLQRSEAAAIGGLTQRSDRDATMRLRIALLAQFAASVDGLADRRLADDCAAALLAYRSNALAWLVPLCVASAGHTGLELAAPAPVVDAAGRRLIASLRAAAVA